MASSHLHIKETQKRQRVEMRRKTKVSISEIKDNFNISTNVGYPDFEKPFESHSDGRTQALGAVFYQQQN